MGTDLNIEITRIQQAMYQAFTVKNEEQIYDPGLIREICIKEAVKPILDNIIRGMTEPRHIHAKIQLNKKLMAITIYNLCHPWCNFHLTTMVKWYQSKS